MSNRRPKEFIKKSGQPALKKEGAGKPHVIALTHKGHTKVWTARSAAPRTLPSVL